MQHLSEGGIGIQIKRRTSDSARLLRKAFPQVKLVNCDALRVKLMRRSSTSVALGLADEGAFTASSSSCMAQSHRASCAPFLANCPPKLGTIFPALTGKCSTPLEQREASPQTD